MNAQPPPLNGETRAFSISGTQSPNALLPFVCFDHNHFSSPDSSSRVLISSSLCGRKSCDKRYVRWRRNRSMRSYGKPFCCAKCLILLTYAPPHSTISSTLCWLSMYFPSKKGFRLGRYSESDSAKLKTIAVRRGMNIVLLITWTPPHKRDTIIFDWRGRFQKEAFSQPVVHRLHASGMDVGCAELNFSTGHETVYRHSWRYEFLEDQGMQLVSSCFHGVWAQCGLHWESSDTVPDVEDALDFLSERPRKKARVVNSSVAKARPYSSRYWNHATASFWDMRNSTSKVSIAHGTSLIFPSDNSKIERLSSPVHERLSSGCDDERSRLPVDPRRQSFLTSQFSVQRYG